MIVADDRVDLSVRQFSEAWRLMCTGVAGHTAAVADGVEYIFSGCPIPFFNVAFLTGRNISAAALKAGADVATHRSPSTATTLNRTRSPSRRTRLSSWVPVAVVVMEEE